MKKNKRKIDLILLLIYPIIGSLFSLILKINAFESIIIFFAIPALYLTIKAIQYSKKAILFSIIAGVPLIIIVDYIAQITKQWVIPSSIFSFKLLGVIPIEVILWTILNLYLIIMFYEYFLDKHVTKKLWYPHIKYLIIIILFLFILFITFYFYLPTLLNIPFFYLFFGIILLLIPIIIQMSKYPKMNIKFFKTAAYFFYLSFIYEVTALQLNWWHFSGTNFIGWISLFNIKFPLEELIFWISLFAMAVLTYYEYFDDDEK